MILRTFVGFRVKLSEADHKNPGGRRCYIKKSDKGQMVIAKYPGWFSISDHTQMLLPKGKGAAEDEMIR